MPEHIPLDGATNFRDFGGYATPNGTIAPGKLFRSDRLSELTPNDYRKLAELGIELVVDLRRPSELESHPTQWPGAKAPELWHAPLIEDGTPGSLQALMEETESQRSPERAVQQMVVIYRQLVNDALPRRQYKQIIERLAHTDSPRTIVHCSGGKDRTGVVVALIQSALGVAKQDVIDDFMMSAHYYDGAALMHERASQVLDTSSADYDPEYLLPIFTVYTDYIEATFEEIEGQFGDTTAYLQEAVGVSPRTLTELRAKLLA